MRYFALTALVLNSLALVSQPQKTPRMAPVYGPGYYVTLKGDTVSGSIQVNPQSDTEFYTQFNFKPKNAKKPKVMSAERVKAYGYGLNRHFISITYSEKKCFVQRLTHGRLRLYEFKTAESNSNDQANHESFYFIRDISANGDSSLEAIRKLSKKYYKKALKPYMQEQHDIWNSLDKFNFNKDKLIEALNEFNRLYTTNIR